MIVLTVFRIAADVHILIIKQWLELNDKIIMNDDKNSVWKDIDNEKLNTILNTYQYLDDQMNSKVFDDQKISDKKEIVLKEIRNQLKRVQ